MKKALLITIVAALLLGAAGGCAAQGEPLRIGILPDVDSIPLIIAQEMGYFEQEGADVVVERFTSAADRESALQAGAIDGAVSDILAAAFLTKGGFDVAITSMTNGSYKLLAGPAMDGEDLAGKSVAISANTIIEYATDRMLEKMGIEDVEKVVVAKIPVRLEMLNTGQVDAATLPEPLASSAVKAGATVIDSTDNLGINPGVLVFTKSATEEKCDALEAFYRAYNRAVDYLKSEPAESWSHLLVSAAGFPEDAADVLTLPAYTSAALPPADEFDAVMQWLVDKELIDGAYEYDALVDARFVK